MLRPHVRPHLTSVPSAPLGRGPGSHRSRRPRCAHQPGRSRALPRDAGQTTAEYALVLLGAAAIAVLLITWASKSGAIGALFDAVLSSVLGSVR